MKFVHSNILDIGDQCTRQGGVAEFFVVDTF